MEFAGLGIGVIGLVGTCLDVLDKVDAYKSFGSDSQAMTLCFEADKYRFGQWLQAIGIVNGRLEKDHHPLLDDPALQPLLYNILSCVCSIWGVGSATLGAFNAANLDHADSSLSCDDGKPMKAQKMLNAAQARLGAKKAKIGWALSGKAKLMAQLEAFDALVDRLHRLVPPTRTSIGPPGAFAPPDARMNQLEDPASVEHRRLISEMRDLVKRENQHAFAKWLGAATVTNNYFEKCLSTRLGDTCGWIFATSSFLEWESLNFPNNTAKVLWVNGPAGYGKTILCASIIQHLKTTIAPPPSASSALSPSPAPSTLPASLAYHFCSSGHESRDDPLVIVRSWISQLLSGSEEALTAALNYIPANEAGSATERELWEVLGAIVQLVPLCTLVVDGLDECAASHADALQATYDRFPIVNPRASFLARLKETTAGTTTRVLVVSRDEIDIRSHLRPSGGSDAVGVSDAGGSQDERGRGRDSWDSGAAPVTLSEHQITAGDVHSDVGLFASSVVQKQLPKKDAALQESLAAQMADKCDGMFLWIRLQERRLLAGRHNKQRLLDVVQQMPPGLDRLYDRNMLEIMRLDSHQRRRALAILRWTAFALRPLTVNEITDALALVDDDDCEDLCAEELPDTMDEDYVEDQIVSICCSLIEVRRDNIPDATISSGTLHFVHFSVKQYLLSATLRPELSSVDRIPFANTDVQQAYLARLCLQYLLTSDAWDSDRRSPLLSYAAFGWYRHVNLGALDDESLTALICKFFHLQSRRWDQWQEHRRNHMEAKLGPEDEELALHGSRLYVAASLGLLKAADFLCIQSAAELNDASGSLGTPLQAAASIGHLPLIQYLLNRGADINACGGTYGSALNAAVAKGHDDAVRYLISKEADVTLTDENERAALFIATVAGQIPVAKLLLERGADVAVTEAYGWTPLMAAAAGGFVELVSLILKRGADPRTSNTGGVTPLHLAVHNGHTELVKLLVDYGANLEQADKLGSTPLFKAATGGNAELVRRLLELGANFKAAKNNGSTPLHAAAAGGHIEVVKLLVEYGANLKQADKYGFTPLVNAAAGGYVELVRLMLERGANLKATKNKGVTPLFVAADNGCIGVVKLLIEYGADLDETYTEGFAGGYGITPLYAAARGGHVEVVELLLEQSADVAASTDTGDTLLHLAVSFGNVEIVKLLLQRGADTEVLKTNGWSPLTMAVFRGHLETSRMLLEHSTNHAARSSDISTALFTAASDGNAKVIRLLLELGADVDLRNYEGWTPLALATMFGHAEVVKILLEQGATSVNPWNDDGRTPLILAVKMCQAEVVKLLLAQGAEVNFRNINGWTPLALAAEGGYAQIVKLLLERGADVDPQDNEGWTPLTIAAMNSHVEVVKLLLEQGANVNHRTDEGWTPLTLAAMNGHAEVVKLLLAQGADVDLRNYEDWTPLHWAVSRRHVELVKLLLEHGAEVNASTTFTGTALHLALHNRSTTDVQALLGRGASPLIPDGFGRTVYDWARIQGLSDLAGTPLASVSDHESNLATHQRRLRRAVVRVAGALLAGGSRIHYLRWALTYLGDHDSAQDIAAFGTGVWCEACNASCREGFHSCTTCFDRDFCNKCAGDSDRSKRGWCMDHTLFASSRTLNNGDVDGQSRLAWEELLKRLVAKYSVDEDGDEIQS